MPPRTSRPASTSTLLPPILALLHPSDPSTTPPNAYSAHQKALTTVARIQGQAPGVAVDICFAVARELLKLDTAAPQEEGEEASKGKTQGQGQGQGEAGSAVELAVKGLGIAEGLEGEGEARMATITQLIALTPSTSSGPWRKKLVDAAVKYSVAVHDGASPAGDAGLHHYVGELYYRDHDFILAEPHLIASAKRDSAVTLAKMMFEWSQKGTLDPGPYAVRGVLPYLLHQPPSILPASTFLSTFLSLLSSSSSPAVQFLSTAPSIPESPLGDIQLTSSPTLNFLQLAILTVQRAPAVGASAVQARGTDGGAARDWEGLCGRYIRLGGREGVLANRDVQEALGQIGMNVFLIPPPRSAQPDMLQNLMGSLFGGGR